MAVFFTADPHFGHANIIEYASRPFANVETMDGAIVDAWNEDVGPNDTLYCLGDWCLGVPDKAKVANVMRHRLRAGRIVFVRGNHDPANDPRFDAVFDEVHDLLHVSLGGRRFVLCHYAMAIWNSMHKGALHVFGHSHGTYAPPGRSLDVGVDTHDFRVYSVDHIVARLDKIPIPRLDRHGA